MLSLVVVQVVQRLVPCFRRNGVACALLLGLACAPYEREEEEGPGPIQRTTDELQLALVNAGQALEGEAEIHAWIGFGKDRIQDYFRASRTGLDWAGEYYVWWQRSDAELNAQQAACQAVTRSERFVLCRVAGPTTTEMAQLIDRLRDGQIRALPDPSTLSARETLYADGVSLVVELKEASQRRRYRYHNPEKQTFPQASLASALIWRMRGFRRHNMKVRIPR